MPAEKQGSNFAAVLVPRRGKKPTHQQKKEKPHETGVFRKSTATPRQQALPTPTRETLLQEDLRQPATDTEQAWMPAETKEVTPGR